MAERIALDEEPECEGFERVDRGDVRYKLGADALPWSNGVAYARWRPEEVEQRAKEIIALFRERGVAFTWQIGPNTDAVGLSRMAGAKRREGGRFGIGTVGSQTALCFHRQSLVLS